MDSFSINGVVQEEYLYNALGQQVVRRMTQAGKTIHVVHDLDGNRLAEYEIDNLTGAQALLQEYIWFDGVPVAVVDGQTDEVFFVRTDHIGRPLFATEDTGVKVWAASYLPFGGVDVSTGPAIDLRFPGQWFHASSGLHQNWMRDYDPTTGRYMQADPLGLVDGAGVYGYALQNPGLYVDPRGEQASQTGGGLSSIHDRFVACVASNDPLTNTQKLALLGIAGPVPKKLVGLPRGTKGASPFTTLPSIAAHKATAGKANLSRGGRAARNIGRLGYVGLIGYGWYMLGVEAKCACAAWE